MILTGSAVVVAALVTLAVPCIRGTLMVRDARHRKEIFKLLLNI